jgi:hypothetical protein
MTESNILKQYNRYMAIDEVLNDVTLWGMITGAMLDRYSNQELKNMGSGQVSKSNMLERRCMEKFDAIYQSGAIFHSVTGKDLHRICPIVPNNIAQEVKSYIATLEF